MYDEVKYLPAGDKALVMEFANEIEPSVNQKIRASITAIEKNKIAGIQEMIPTYRSVLIIYDPVTLKFAALVDALKKIEKNIGEEKGLNGVVFEIPTVYGGKYGPDIDFVAKHNNLTTEEVIQIHTSKDYLIYMLGFTPGFTYLGGMSDRIETPRLATPRTAIPAGSTGIAGKQTGIYPIQSPGGWQLIGRTPVKLYDPYKEPPVFMHAGDYVRFIRITEKDYEEIAHEVEKGTYKVVTKKAGE